MIRTFLVFALKAAVLTGVVWYIWPKIDIPRFEGALRQTSALMALAVFCLFLVQAILAAMRWRWIVQTTGHRLRVMDSLDAWLVGQCASQVLPGVIGGDAARILRLRRYGVPMSLTTVTVVMDRFVGFVVLMILSIISIPVLAYRSDAHFVPHEISWTVFILTLLLSVFGLCLRYSSRLPIMHTAPALKPVQRALSRLPTDRLSLLVVGLTSLGTNFTVIVSAYILGHGINPGIDFPVCVGLLPLVTLLSFLPISIAGWGLREALMVGLFGLVDIPAADALSISVQLGIANLALGLVGGIFWLTYPARTPGPIPAQIAHCDADEPREK